MNNRNGQTFEVVKLNPRIDAMLFWKTRNPEQDKPKILRAMAVVKDISKLENREGITFQLISKDAEGFMVTLSILDTHFKQFAEEDNIISMESAREVYPLAPRP